VNISTLLEGTASRKMVTSILARNLSPVHASGFEFCSRRPLVT
jgi:hypothetical protein